MEANHINAERGKTMKEYQSLYDTIANEYANLTREDLRRIALELIYSMYKNNSKWDYVDQINDAIENINEYTDLNFKNEEIA